MLRILLLEDDEMLGETIESLLEDEGYDVEWMKRGDEVVDATFEKSFDLYIFDIGIPDIDGLELLKSLRDADDDTPTIFISARIDLVSIEKGFANGAMDYIKKPFFPEELLVRIKARFEKEKREIEYGAISYDPVSKIAKKDGEILSLGEVQVDLLHLFMTNIGRVMDKGELYDSLHHPSDTALRVALNKLRKRTSLPIKNIRGLGYILEES